MKEYLTVTRDMGPSTVKKRMRLEGEPLLGNAVLIIEREPPANPGYWEEYVRFELTSSMAHLFAHAGGTVGYSGGRVPDHLNVTQRG